MCTVLVECAEKEDPIDLSTLVLVDSDDLQLNETAAFRRQTWPSQRFAVIILCCLALISAAPVSSQEPPTEPQPADDAPAASFSDRTPLTAKFERILPPTYIFLKAAPNIGGGVWLAQGPGPALSGQVEGIANGEVVGAVHTVAAHPTDPDTLYAGGVNGGIWKTTNATSTRPFWTPLTDFETSLSIGALEFDPTDATHMTLVAGVGRYSSFGSYGGIRSGLLKTIDGGNTWSALGSVASVSPSGISGVAPRGMTIVASSNSSDLFACLDVGIWRSTDGGANFSKMSVTSGVPDGVAFDLASDLSSSSTLYTGITFGSLCTAGNPGGSLTNGIYRSTDTGATWTKVSSAAMDALIVDGTTNNIEIAADGLDVFVNIIQSGRPAGILHSGDGAASWTAMDIPRTPEGAPIPIAPPDALIPGAPIVIDHTPTGFPHGLSSGMEVEVMGALGTLGANAVWTVSRLSATAFSLNGSSDFNPWVAGSGTSVKVVGLNPKVKPGSQGGIHASIRTDPGNSGVVYLGGDRQYYPFPNFLGALDYSGRLFRGNSSIAATGAIPSPQWEHLTHSDAIGAVPGGGTSNTSAPHADSREMVFDANGVLVEGDDGGIYRRTSPANNTGDWLSINSNLQVTEQHAVAWDAVSDVIISGNQDVGTTQQISASSLVLDSIQTADGGDVAVDDLSVAGISTRYSSSQYLGRFRRREYDPANGLLSEVFPTLIPLGGRSLFINFLTPVELNAVIPTQLVFGGCNAVFESFDKGDTITDVPGLLDASCSSPIMTFPQNAIAYGGMVGAVPDPAALWVGSGSAVFVRTMAGTNLFATATAFPGTTVTDIVLDPTDTSTAYVLDATDVYQTHNGGTTWTTITGNLTDTRLGAAAIDGGSSPRLLVGGRDGVFMLALPTPGVAATGPFVWGEIGTGLPNAPVWDLEWDATDNVLLAGTLGRGAWTLQENGTCGFPKNLTVRNQSVTAATTFKACNNIFGGTMLTVDGTVDFEAGVSVAFGNETVLGGTVTVKISSGLISP